MSEDRTTMVRAYGEALVREIRVEMARHDIPSVRALAERAGITRGRLNQRMNPDSEGHRVPLGHDDLYRIADVFGLHPAELVTRAAEASGWTPPSQSSQKRKRHAG